MDRKKISTTVYITQEQNQLLKLLNAKTKVPIAEYVREGIDLVLERHKQQLPGQMSLLPSENEITDEMRAIDGLAPRSRLLDH